MADSQPRKSIQTLNSTIMISEKYKRTHKHTLKILNQNPLTEITGTDEIVIIKAAAPVHVIQSLDKIVESVHQERDIVEEIQSSVREDYEPFALKPNSSFNPGKVLYEDLTDRSRLFLFRSQF